MCDSSNGNLDKWKSLNLLFWPQKTTYYHPIKMGSGEEVNMLNGIHSSILTSKRALPVSQREVIFGLNKVHPAKPSNRGSLPMHLCTLVCRKLRVERN